MTETRPYTAVRQLEYSKSEAEYQVKDVDREIQRFSQEMAEYGRRIESSMARKSILQAEIALIDAAIEKLNA